MKVYVVATKPVDNLNLRENITKDIFPKTSHFLVFKDIKDANEYADTKRIEVEVWNDGCLGGLAGFTTQTCPIFIVEIDNDIELKKEFKDTETPRLSEQEQSNLEAYAKRYKGYIIAKNKIKHVSIKGFENESYDFFVPEKFIKAIASLQSCMHTALGEEKKDEINTLIKEVKIKVNDFYLSNKSNFSTLYEDISTILESKPSLGLLTPDHRSSILTRAVAGFLNFILFFTAFAPAISYGVTGSMAPFSVINTRRNDAAQALLAITGCTPHK